MLDARNLATPKQRACAPGSEIIRCVIAFLGLWLLFGAPTVRARVKIPFTPLKLFYLPNGLRAVMAPDDEAPVVDVQVWYHAGSKDERPGMLGFAHLFEHLMFDGTRNVPAGQFSSYIVRCGGVDNAYTTTDVTVFWETLPANSLPTALWLEADRMRGLRITQAALDKEKEVVEEERRRRFGNEPYGNIIAELYEHAFTVSPYRHMPIGSTMDVVHASLPAVETFYNAHYVPNDATLVITGEFNPSQAEKWIQEYFGPLQGTGDPLPRNFPQEPPQTAVRRVKLTQNVALPALVEGYHIPPAGSPDSYPLEWAAKILGDGDSSWLNRQMVYQRQMAMQVECTAQLAEEPNLFLFSAVMNEGYTPSQGESAIAAAIGRFENGVIPSRDLARARNELLRDFVMSRQTAQSRAEALGQAAVILKHPDLYNTGIDRLLRVTPSQIQHAAEKYLAPGNETVVEVYPKHK